MILIIANLISTTNNISNYGGYVLLVFCICYIFIDVHNDEAGNIILISSLIAISGIINSSGIIYIFLDVLLVFFILTSIDLGVKYKNIKDKQIFFLWTSVGFICLSIICSLNPSFYIIPEDGGLPRFGGIFNAINFSANIFAIFEICLWEIYRRFKPYNNKLIIVVLLLTLIYYTEISGTRSLLFFYPYWFYQLYLQLEKSKFKKLILLFVVIIGVAVIPSMINLLTTNLRFQEGDASIGTRLVLYDVLVSGILDYNIIFPHGSSAAQEMIVNFTGDERYSPHNNFLSYLYDWGFIFLFIIFVIYKRLKKARLLSQNMLFIYLGVSSFALHNMLFSPFIWIPVILLLIINNRQNVKPDNPRYSTKI